MAFHCKVMQENVLLMLNVTFAIDSIDHYLMLNRLRYWVSVSGSALEWFSSYLSELSFSVTASKFRSASTSLTYGVPQGCVLGPLLFLLYLLTLQHFLRTICIIATQMTFSYICLLSSKMFTSYRSRLDSVMVDNFLQLNEAKTEVLDCAPDKFVPKVMETLGPLATFANSSIRNCGGTFHSGRSC